MLAGDRRTGVLPLVLEVALLRRLTGVWTGPETGLNSVLKVFIWLTLLRSFVRAWISSSVQLIHSQKVMNPASARGLHGADIAHYNRFSVARTARGWTLDVTFRGYDPAAGGFADDGGESLELVRD